MKLKRWLRWPLMIAIGFVIVGAASPARTKKFPVPGHGTLELQIPARLDDLFEQPAGDVPPAIALRADDGSYGAMVVVDWRGPDTSDFGSPEHLRRVLETERAPYVRQVGATEAPPVVRLSGGPNPGVAYNLVDAALVGKPPERGNWPYMRQGVIRTGDLLLKHVIMMYSTDPAPGVERILMNAVHHSKSESK